MLLLLLVCGGDPRVQVRPGSRGTLDNSTSYHPTFLCLERFQDWASQTPTQLPLLPQFLLASTCFPFLCGLLVSILDCKPPGAGACFIILCKASCTGMEMQAHTNAYLRTTSTALPIKVQAGHRGPLRVRRGESIRSGTNPCSTESPPPLQLGRGS